ncbi:hypothetical protein T06_9001 [Trichinella sp. T6]|nr:hypothetical protein T06_9001 [Trichinella sp. T6]
MFRSFCSKCGILASYSITLKYFKVLIYFIHDSITLTSSEYDISSDDALVPLATLVHMDIKAFPSRPSVPLLITNSIFLLLWTPCLVMFTSVCSRCGITNILGYVKRTHFIHDSITLTSSEFDVSSDGSLIAADATQIAFPTVLMLFLVTHITLTSSEYDISSDDALVPLATLVHMDIKAFPSRPSVPLLITNSIFLLLWTPCLVMFTSVCSRCGITNILGYVKRTHFIHDSITLTSSEFDVSSDGSLIAADATQIAFPTVLMLFLVTQFHVSVRNCEDESRILNDLH